MSIDPLFHLGFPDADNISGAVFSPDSSTLYLLNTPTVANLWAALVHSWPETGAIIVAATAVVLLLWLMLRLRCRSQSPDRLYCRRCNYDVGGVGEAGSTSSLPARCSECGLDLRKRTPVRGSTALRRSVAPITFVALIAGAYALPWLLRLPRDGWLNDHYLWTWAWVDEQLATSTRDPLKPFRKQICRIDEVDIASASHRRTLWRSLGYPLPDLSISPDGRSLFFRTVDRMWRIDARSGKLQQAITFEERCGDSYGPPIAGFDSKGVAAFFADLAAGGRSRLRAWDLGSGEVRTVLEEAGYWAHGNRWVSRRYVPFRADGSDYFLSCPGVSQMYVRSFETRLYSARGDLLRAFNLPNQATASADPVIAPDGHDLFWSTMSEGVAHVDPLTGQERERLRPPGMFSGWDSLGISRNGRWLAWAQVPDSNIAIRNLGTNRWHSELTLPPGRWISPRHLVFSPDGRFFAAIAFQALGPTPGPGARYVHKVFVFNLAKLNGAPRAEPTDP